MLLEKFVDLVVVAAWIGLIAEEVDLVVVGQEFQAVGFVPSDGEHVEANLAAN